MRFGGVTAVDQVDFRLREGELRCLIGPNGAGKSTFFKCLSGQLRPTEGDILLKDRRITGLDPFAVARHGVGIKTQVPNVFEGLDVRENIWLSARRHHGRREARRQVDDMLERLRLGDVAGATLDTLAHGQRQWVELALVLAADPWLVLLDEPTAGMTQEEVHRTAELISEINVDTTLVVVEHDMHFIRMISDVVTVFVQGAVLIEDTMDVVAADPRVREVYLGADKYAIKLPGEMA